MEAIWKLSKTMVKTVQYILLCKESYKSVSSKLLLFSGAKFIHFTTNNLSPIGVKSSHFDKFQAWRSDLLIRIPKVMLITKKFLLKTVLTKIRNVFLPFIPRRRRSRRHVVTLERHGHATKVQRDRLPHHVGQPTSHDVVESDGDRTSQRNVAGSRCRRCRRRRFTGRRPDLIVVADLLPNVLLDFFLVPSRLRRWLRRRLSLFGSVGPFAFATSRTRF